MAAEGMRACFMPDKPMDKSDYKPLWVGCETARATVSILNLFGKVSAAYTRKQLREDIVKEVKYLRTKTEKKEADLLGAPLLKEVMNVLWDR